MAQETSKTDLFTRELRDTLIRETRGSHTIKIAKHESVYTCGERGDAVYFIEGGQVKLVMVSTEGREGIIAVHGAGELFGELSLSGFSERIETTTAMEGTSLRVIPASKFFGLLESHSLIEGFVGYLSARIAHQQEVITDLATSGSEQRLGTTLLELARELGNKEGNGLTLEHKMSHEELSEMVGTTRARVSVFMQRFRALGLIETRAQRCLLVRDKDLSDYLTQLASC